MQHVAAAEIEDETVSVFHSHVGIDHLGCSQTPAIKPIIDVERIGIVFKSDDKVVARCSILNVQKPGYHQLVTNNLPIF